jgi:hypothetical protein
MMFGPKELHCPAGVRTTILQSLAAGMPASWSVRFANPAGGPVSGVVLESRSYLPFAIAMSAPSELGLAPQMGFNRGWFDASHRVDVVPSHDLVAVIE